MLRKILRNGSLFSWLRQNPVQKVVTGHAACNFHSSEHVLHISGPLTQFPKCPGMDDLRNPYVITRFRRSLVGQAATRRQAACSYPSDPRHGQRRQLTDGSPSVPPYELYKNTRRLQSVGLTTLALGQAGFWASATNLTASNLSAQVADPLIGPTWTVIGFGLSAAFALMTSAYLRRSVAHLHVRNGPVVRVIPRNIFGMLAAPVDVNAKDLVAGRFSTSGRTERHWSFGVKLPSGRTFYYILDMNAGVVDRDAILALAKGGEHFMAWSLKRDALAMKQRWQEWRDDTP